MKRTYRLTLALDDDLHQSMVAAADAQGVPLADLARTTLRVAFTGEAARPPSNVGETATALLQEGLTDEDVLTRILEEFPDARTSKRSIAWYRSKAREAGLPVPTQKEARAAAGRG